jgi:Protein of unknown function (DUF1364)
MGVVSQVLRDSARGRDCTMELPGICNHDPEKVVLAHLPSPVKGMRTKSDDWHAVFCCSSCHDYMDQHPSPAMVTFQMRALQRTQKFWFDNSYLSLKNDPVLHLKRPAKGSTKSLPPKSLFGKG